MVGAPASYLKLEELSGSPLCTGHHLGKGVAPQGLTRVHTGGCCRLGWVQIMLQSLGKLCFSQCSQGAVTDCALRLLLPTCSLNNSFNSFNIGPAISSDSTSNSRWSFWLCKHDKSHSWQGDAWTSYLGRFFTVLNLKVSVEPLKH